MYTEGIFFKYSQREMGKMKQFYIGIDLSTQMFIICRKLLIDCVEMVSNLNGGKYKTYFLNLESLVLISKSFLFSLLRLLAEFYK